MMTMTNFTMSKFNSLWGLCEAQINASWYEGRGRRNQTSSKDAFFMMLSVLKHYRTWDKHAADFNLRVPTIERMMTRMITIAEPILVSILIRPVAMTSQRRQQFVFQNFPEALYATDVKFQPANRPNLSYLDAKRYYSSKHKLDGFKLEGSVALPGRYVNVCDHVPGSVSDLTVFVNRIEVHTSALKKTDSEKNIPDNGEGSTDFPDSWAVLQDKGYQGVDEAARSIRPKKKPIGSTLSRQELERNQRVSLDRVLVENMFGRTCQLRKIAYSTFTWSEAKFDVVQRLVWALTNYHTSLHPLRAQDNGFYREVLARYYSMGEGREDRRRRQREQSLDRRNVRLQLDRAGRQGILDSQLTQI
ncbi:hypothetical protein Ae201684P_011721 [Aphanomyces euteiches]|uniref:DDE Tnp4 domain-containing protein n=1 Tax=Aphanomyces euteiches TaxID=100861 RepID=A0A6G0WU48_9STRA|nr:hypothetical protein Ae201684_011604 [Aphanomyces euteiches]KAH9096988.1 hypothetical protein Ae201684P_011721 [Aphanomyces euteiches]